MSDIGAHLPYLVEEGLKAKLIIELGTRFGTSTGALLIAVNENHGKLLSVDIDDVYGLIKQTYGNLTDRWTFVHNSSQSQVCLDTIERWRGTSLVDLVFNDASHAAEETTQELVLYAPLIKVGGKMIFHDTDPRNDYWRVGVHEPLYRFLEQHPEWQVERAVDYAEGMTTIVRTK